MSRWEPVPFDPFHAPVSSPVAYILFGLNNRAWSTCDRSLKQALRHGYAWMVIR